MTNCEADVSMNSFMIASNCFLKRTSWIMNSEADVSLNFSYDC